jgi:uncharacterized protein YyaL (SSP411 family)
MAGQLLASDAHWLTSVPEATAEARKENKLILLDFTGSDWCGWCKKLDAETFSKSEFADYAQKNLVLVQVDFPAQKPQSAELKAANQALQEKYGVHGYPTLVVLNADGKIVWQHEGYLAGGPGTMIAKLDKAKSK